MSTCPRHGEPAAAPAPPETAHTPEVQAALDRLSAGVIRIMLRLGMFDPNYQWPVIETKDEAPRQTSRDHRRNAAQHDHELGSDRPGDAAPAE